MPNFQQFEVPFNKANMTFEIRLWGLYQQLVPSSIGAYKQNELKWNVGTVGAVDAVDAQLAWYAN